MRLLVLTPNPLEPEIAGPLQRQWEMAHALARAGHPVTLAGTSLAGAIANDGVVLAAAASRPAIAALAARHDAIIASGAMLTPHLRAVAAHRPIIADCITPDYFEVLADHAPAADDPHAAVKTRHLAIHQRARRIAMTARLCCADRYLVGSERQRDLLAGWLAASGIISAERGTHRCPPDELIAVVANGIAPLPPPNQQSRRRMLGLRDDDTVVIWWGSAYDWYDLETVLDAIVALAPSRPDIRLVLGAMHPPHQPVPEHAARLLRRPDIAPLLGNNIIVLDKWIPYTERGAVLQAADAGIYAHHPSWESRYAVRTRFADYLWAGLPVIISDGDCHAGSVRQCGLGAVLPPADADAWRATLLRLADDHVWRTACRAAVNACRHDMCWDKMVCPLLALLALPRPSPAPRPAAAAMAAHLAGRWRAAYAEGGLGNCLRKTRIHLGKLFSRR